MASKFDEMREAVEEAEYTLRAANNIAERMAELLTGPRLRSLSPYELKRLKRELQKFDSHKGNWK